MSEPLTATEQEFLKLLKRKLMFSNVEIKTKVSIGDLCSQRKDIPFVFGKDEKIVKEILIDFILLYKGRVLAGIELIDEPEELKREAGKKILIDTLFKTMDYEYFRVVDLTRLKDASQFISDKIKLLKKKYK